MADHPLPRVMRGALIHLVSMAVVLMAATGAIAAPGGNGQSAEGNGPPAHSNAGGSPQGQTQRQSTPAPQRATPSPRPTPAPRQNNAQSGGGANTSGPYNSTRDGSPSGNGNGNGNATGRPCAGCVGNADNKNPPGQLPNAASDGNRGYECDNNRGIGRTNPAHTGCSNTTQPPGVTTQPPGVTPALSGGPAPSPAGDSPSQRSNPQVAAGPGENDVAGVDDSGEPVQDRRVPLPGFARGELPFTGFNVPLVLLYGLAALGTGLLAARASRA